MKQRSNTLTYLLIGTGGCLVAIICFLIVAIGGTVAYRANEGSQVAVVTATPTPLITLAATADSNLEGLQPAPTNTPQPSPIPTLTAAEPTRPRPTPLPTSVIPTLIAPASIYNLRPPREVDQRPIPLGSEDDATLLLAMDYPAHDYYGVEARLGKGKMRARTIESQIFALHDQHTFETEGGRITATLMAISDRANFWVEDGLVVDTAELEAVAARLDTELYPLLVDLFGQEWQPGVDNDPRFHILHLAKFERTELGYFDSGDEYPNNIFRNSNEKEIIYMNMEQLTLGDELYYGTLVHEIQHLIQWNNDRNESVWLNEGLSQLAEHRLGFDTVQLEDYLIEPGLQFNVWSYDEEEIYGHYSASALFVIYLWEQLGDAAVRVLARHPADGIASVQAVLAQFAPDRPLNQFISDFYIANYLHNHTVSPRYDYAIRFQPVDPDEIVRERPHAETQTMHQFGARYIDIRQRGPITISFAGDTVVDLIEAQPHSGRQIWLAPALNNLNASLTFAADLTTLNSATLNFWAWYDLETDYDYAYVTLSTDDGASWQILAPTHQKTGRYGPSFNGLSTRAASNRAGWVAESISLNSFVGRRVLIRFEVLTDSGVTKQGFALDDITIPELGIVLDADNDNVAAEALGFVPVSPAIPQQWSIQLVQFGRDAQVVNLPLDNRNQGQWTIDLTDDATLVIAPLTPFVRDDAAYWLQIE